MTRKPKGNILYDDSDFSEDDEEFGEPGPVWRAIFNLISLAPCMFCFALCALFCYGAAETTDWFIFIFTVVMAAVTFVGGVLSFLTWLTNQAETVR